MIHLKECVQNSKALAKALRENGRSHIQYRLYTSMERALSTILYGKLFLTNGSNWNDTDDKRILADRRLYATCFSTSTQENIAMWMLYSDEKGKKGASLVFPKGVINDILENSQVFVGNFGNDGKFNAIKELKREQYELFMSDIVYIDKCDKDSVKITIREEHVTVSREILNDTDIFTKHFAWNYEKECRMILRLQEKNLIKENYSATMVMIPKKSMAKLRKDRLVRSPLYKGAECGRPSELIGKVDWEL